MCYETKVAHSEIFCFGQERIVAAGVRQGFSWRYESNVAQSKIFCFWGNKYLKLGYFQQEFVAALALWRDLHPQPEYGGSEHLIKLVESKLANNSSPAERGAR